MLHPEASSGCNQLRSLVFVMTSVMKPVSCKWVVKEASKSFTAQVLRISPFFLFLTLTHNASCDSVRFFFFETVAQCPVISGLDKLLLKFHQRWECHQLHLRHHRQIGFQPICF